MSLTCQAGPGRCRPSVNVRVQNTVVAPDRLRRQSSSRRGDRLRARPPAPSPGRPGCAAFPPVSSRCRVGTRGRWRAPSWRGDVSVHGRVSRRGWGACGHAASVGAAGRGPPPRPAPPPRHLSREQNMFLLISPLSPLPLPCLKPNSEFLKTQWAHFCQLKIFGRKASLLGCPVGPSAQALRRGECEASSGPGRRPPRAAGFQLRPPGPRASRGGVQTPGSEESFPPDNIQLLFRVSGGVKYSRSGGKGRKASLNWNWMQAPQTAS